MSELKDWLESVWTIGLVPKPQSICAMDAFHGHPVESGIG
jgi:hypothetical protein